MTAGGHMGDQLIKFPLKQLMAEYAVAICVEILHAVASASAHCTIMSMTSLHQTFLRL